MRSLHPVLSFHPLQSCVLCSGKGRVSSPETWRMMALHYQTPHPQNPLWDDDNLVVPKGLALECAVLALSRSTGREWQKRKRRGTGEEKREVVKRESAVGSTLELTSACHRVLVLAGVAQPKDLPRSHLPTQPIVSTHGLG